MGNLPTMQWARDLLRTVFALAVAVPATGYYAAKVWFLAARSPNDPRVESLVRRWASVCLKAAGVRLEVEGADLVDPSRSYVVVSNHLSGMDIMAHFAALPVPIRFLAKTELFRIPVFGRAMRSIGIVEVDRGAGRSIHEHINTTAKAAVDRGLSLIIYPEGTRPRDGVMRPFKKGAFTIATSMQLPVVPTAIRGSRRVWRPGSLMIKSGTIEVTVMAPIETVGLGPPDVDGLRKRVNTMVIGAVNTG